MGHTPPEEDEPTAEEMHEACHDFVHMVHRGFAAAFMMKAGAGEAYADRDSLLAAAFALYALDHSDLPLSKALPVVAEMFLDRVTAVISTMEDPIQDGCDCGHCSMIRGLYEQADQRHAEIQMQLAKALLQTQTEEADSDSEDSETQTWRH